MLRPLVQLEGELQELPAGGVLNALVTAVRPWTAGAQVAGTLVESAGLVYLTTTARANGAVPPGSTTTATYRALELEPFAASELPAAHTAAAGLTLRPLLAYILRQLPSGSTTTPPPTADPGDSYTETDYTEPEYSA
ncbi:hypothetical protein CDA63_11825 [Hymenobacter amundsenii]|uniref:Uncharacterized protein n=1 Tax=Hymenobacter amundsenii TaxID=2006685 RepID=A0A246FK17_9BACT|nr:hypothetical protein [Hymenobacter amundsenii]OWP62900.1 hypothetical protein CDA63_11825 [Hymenobacter amundsenii]